MLIKKIHALFCSLTQHTKYVFPCARYNYVYIFLCQAYFKLKSLSVCELTLSLSFYILHLLHQKLTVLCTDLPVKMYPNELHAYLTWNH